MTKFFVVGAPKSIMTLPDVPEVFSPIKVPVISFAVQSIEPSDGILIMVVPCAEIELTLVRAEPSFNLTFAVI
ncbi:hypothetical protein D3C71_2202080 [compost metagenome]